MRTARLTIRRAFTLTELLVVIFVVGVLTTIVVTGTSSALELARKRNTSVTMANTLLAIETFATENPLGQIYDRSSALTYSDAGGGFGPYPPYQLPVPPGARQDARAGKSVYSMTLAPPQRGADPNPKDTDLEMRLAYDLSGLPDSQPLNRRQVDNWVQFGEERNENFDGNDDARALSAYMMSFAPRAFEQISPDALRPIDPHGRVEGRKHADRIFPRGDGNRDDAQGRDLLAIHDGWGVPLDYLLYVKVDVTLNRAGFQGVLTPSYTIIDQRPVLRSRGMDRETYERYYEAVLDGDADTAATLNDPTQWIWSEPLPGPQLTPSDGGRPGVQASGALVPRQSAGARGRTVQFKPGWVRLAGAEWRLNDVASEVGNGVDYGYLPAFDPGKVR